MMTMRDVDDDKPKDAAVKGLGLDTHADCRSGSTSCMHVQPKKQ